MLHKIKQFDKNKKYLIQMITIIIRIRKNKVGVFSRKEAS